jgi:hypothetical protein
VRERGIGGLHRRRQRVHDLVLDEIGEIARRDRARELAPLVLDFLVLGEGVGDEREFPDVRAEHLAQALGGGLAHRAVAVGQQVQHLVRGQLPAIEGKAQMRHGFVEQSDPGVAAGDRLLMQDLLDLVGELVRAEGPQVAQPGLILRQCRRFQLVREHAVLEAVQLEREEQQLGRDVRHPLLHGLVEAADLRIGHVAGMDQLGVAHDAAQHLLDGFIARHGLAERGAIDRREPALEALPKGLGVLCRFLEIDLQRRRLASGIEIPEVPFREDAEIGRLGRG